MKFFSEIKNRVSEAPHYPEDPDEWNAMFGARKKKPQGDPEDQDFERFSAQQDADADDEISQQRQAQHTAFTKKRKVGYVDHEGAAPNGQRYNKLYVIHAQDMQTANHEEYLFDKHEWGAKKVVDVKKEQNKNGSVTATLYIVDNHKYGTWKPWKEKDAKSAFNAKFGGDNPANALSIRKKSVSEGNDDNPVLGAIIHRIMVGRTDLLAKYGPERIMAAAEDVADFVGDVEEIGSSDVSGWVKQVENSLKDAPVSEGVNHSALQGCQPVAEAGNPEYDDEAGMAKSNLRTMSRAVNGLMDTIKDNDNLPEWAQEKIAKAEMMTTGVWDYLLSQKEQGMNPQVEAVAEADMKSSNAGYNNMLAVMKAVDAGEDATFDLGGEPITLEYPEARFLAGKYKAFLKAGRQEEFLKYMDSPVAFDRLMLQLRHMIDKQKNFKGSVPGERGIEEASMNKVSVPVALAMLKKARSYLDQFDPEDDDDYFDAYETVAAEFNMESNDSSIDPLTDLLDMYEVNPRQAAQALADHLQSQSNGVAEDARTFAPLSKDQYLAQKKALQDIQLDPQTAKDPELRKELMRRTGALRKQAIASGIVDEDAPALAKMAGGLGLGLLGAAGAPAIVGILGPLLGIPLAAYGAYSAAKMGMAGVEKLWDMATDKLGGSDKVEQYATAQIAKLPPEKAQAATAVVKQVTESRKTVESTGPAKMISRQGTDMDESAPPNFPMDLEKKLLAQYKNDPSRAYATMWTLHNKQKPKTESLTALPTVNENEYWCGNSRMAKPIPEGYKKLSNGYLTRK